MVKVPDMSPISQRILWPVVADFVDMIPPQKGTAVGHGPF